MVMGSVVLEGNGNSTYDDDHFVWKTILREECF